MTRRHHRWSVVIALVALTAVGFAMLRLAEAAIADLADQGVQRFVDSPCEQSWTDTGEPPSPGVKAPRVLTALHNHTLMRLEFFNKIAVVDGDDRFNCEMMSK
jgi:hypothetical protein